MAYKTKLVFKLHSKRTQTLLAMFGQTQEKAISSNFKPYYLAIYEVKVLEKISTYFTCLSLTFGHLDF